MLFKNITMLDEHMEIRTGMYLGTEGSFITYIGDKMPENSARYGEVYADSAGKLFIPAFYNAHAHNAMHLMRGYGENLSLMDWLNDRIFPFENKMLPDDIYHATLASCAEMLKFGIVSSSDMYFFPMSAGQAYAESGLKANFAVTFTCFDDTPLADMPSYHTALRLMEEFGSFSEERLKPGMALHAEYTSNERFVRELAEAAMAAGSLMHVHISETAGEVDACRKRHENRSPVRYLADCGLLDMPTTAAHCVHLDDEDIAILKEKNVSVASCPVSNLKLASGICPAMKILDAEINLALGTDSVASNNNLNLLEEIKLFAILHKGTAGDPTVITPAQSLYAATRAGALAQGRSDCGYLKEGFRADISAIDITGIHMQPAYNLLNNLVYSSCGGDVFMTMADGRILYENGSYKTLDIEKIIFNTEKTRLRILG